MDVFEVVNELGEVEYRTKNIIEARNYAIFRVKLDGMRRRIYPEHDWVYTRVYEIWYNPETGRIQIDKI